MSENMESEWLQSIHDVCIDYDGYRDVKGLKRLIDDIKQMTKDALEGKEPYLKLGGDAGNEIPKE